MGSVVLPEFLEGEKDRKRRLFQRNLAERAAIDFGLTDWIEVMKESNSEMAARRCI
jgi:hypothetical protein